MIGNPAVLSETPILPSWATAWAARTLNEADYAGAPSEVFDEFLIFP